MPIQTKKFAGFTGNELKLIALVSMTCDHVGLQLLPNVLFLRILGRLAFPIFAYMIAEGCRYTRSRKKYLLRMVSLAAVCGILCCHGFAVPVHSGYLLPVHRTDLCHGQMADPGRYGIPCAGVGYTGDGVRSVRGAAGFSARL